MSGLASRARAGPVAALLALAALAGVVFPLSTRLAGLQDADGIVTAYMSTRELTWYFWGQDRFLNLLPALAAPVHDVEWNLRLQLLLRAALAFLAPCGVLVFLRPDARFVLLATVLANALLAIVLGDHAAFNAYVQHNPFGTAFALLALAAALCLRGGVACTIAALAVLAVAHAVDIALPLQVLPLLAVAFVFATWPRRVLATFAGLVLVALVLAALHARWFGVAQTDFGVGEASWRVAAVGYRALAAQLRMPVLGAVAVASLVACVACRRHGWTPVLLFAAACVAGVGALACSAWVQFNLHDVRYYLPFVLGFAACVAAWATLAAEPWLLRTRAVVLAAATAFGVACAALGGWSAQWKELVTPDFREAARDWAGIARARDVQLVVGGYWMTWPTLLDIDASHPPAPVYGLATRGGALHERLLELAAHSPDGLRTLCLPESQGRCADAVARTLGATVEVVPESVERFTDAAGRRMRFMRLHVAAAAAVHTNG